MGQLQLGRQPSIDDRFAGPGVENERIGPTSGDADVHRLGDLTRHGAHGDRDALGAPRQDRGASAPGCRGRQGEIDDWLDPDVLGGKR